MNEIDSAEHATTTPSTATRRILVVSATLMIGLMATCVWLIKQANERLDALPRAIDQNTDVLRQMSNTQQGRQWQYITLAPPDNVFDDTLNRLGSDGWELVTARRATSVLGEAAYEVILRREQRAGRITTDAATENVRAVKESLEKRRRELAQNADSSTAIRP